MGQAAVPVRIGVVRPEIYGSHKHQLRTVWIAGNISLRLDGYELAYLSITQRVKISAQAGIVLRDGIRATILSKASFTYV